MTASLLKQEHRVTNIDTLSYVTFKCQWSLLWKPQQKLSLLEGSPVSSQFCSIRFLFLARPKHITLPVFCNTIFFSFRGDLFHHSSRISIRSWCPRNFTFCFPLPRPLQPPNALHVNSCCYKICSALAEWTRMSRSTNEKYVHLGVSHFLYDVWCLDWKWNTNGKLSCIKLSKPIGPCDSEIIIISQQKHVFRFGFLLYLKIFESI